MMIDGMRIEAYHKNDDSVVSEKEASEIMRRKQNDETEQVASAFLTLRWEGLYGDAKSNV